MNKKEHAKEFLTEFSDGKPEWLKTLIKEAIETNGAISETRQGEIFDCLLKNSKLQSQTSTQSNSQQATSKLILESLTHISGVNALCENQTIKFSPDVTVLYGLNGSGKSSYFRILNNISGGTQKNIFPNIYAEEADKKPLNVSIKYKIGSNDKTYNSNGVLTEQIDFRGVKVFDSSYLSGLLQPKNPDETFVYPLGVHLFGYIAKIMDSYSSKLNQSAEAEKLNLPAISINDLSESIKNKFNNREDFNESERNDIKSKFTFSEAEKDNLSDKEDELEKLQQTNYQDRITLVTKENIAFSNFAKKINDAKKNLKDYCEGMKKAFDAFSEAKIKNDEARRQSEIIKKIPKSDTSEWKAFIKAGQEYSSKLEKEEHKKCPYCHQELKTAEAMNIINAYASFLSDTSETELTAAEQKIVDIQKKIGELDVTINISDDIKSVLTDTSNLQKKLDSLITCKTTLLSAKDSGTIPEIALDFSNELKVLEDKQQVNETNLTNLKSSKDKKDIRITELQKSIATLKEKESISIQKMVIEKYFSIYDSINMILAKKTETRTTELTKLSNQAQDALVTEALKTKFENELKLLDKGNLKVELDGKSGTKGNFTTQLKLKGNNQVKDIFSEGEQKAVGLAMFFAEVQNGNYPIILDDPTTSLDHKIAKKLAERLLSFENQIIIFTHYQLFLSALNSSKKGHFCDKYGNSTCGKISKHIFVYQVDETLFGKGKISQYMKKDSKSLIIQIEKEMQSISTSDLKDVPKNMRKCVEYLIDEKILKGQLLRKYSSEEKIGWDELKEINPSGSILVNKLHEIHGRVSGGEIHVDLESEENPLTPEDLQRFLNDLKAIQSDTFKSSK